MKQDIIDKVVSQFKAKFPTVTVPPINWNPKMRTTAGVVRLCPVTKQAKYIKLNPHLLTDDSNLEQTLFHELCHIADYILYGKIGHGPTWKHCMRLMGRQPKRCHQYDTSNIKRKQKRVAQMKCNCSTTDITTQRLNKILRGARYRCTKCKSVCELVSYFEAGEAPHIETKQNDVLVANGLKF